MVPADDPAPTSEFLDLVNRVKAGDDSAMTQLTEKYGPAMRRTARELIGKSLQSHLDSVDLVQSVQLILWLGLRTNKFSLESPENLLGLAKTLIKRKVARYCRNAKPHLSQTIDGKLGDTFGEMCLFPSQDADASRAKELDDFVEHFLSQLGDMDRRLISLRLEGHSTADAARVLNVDAGMLRVRLGRLRARFEDFRDVLAKSAVSVPSQSF
jgi:RNA polymerase sigma factor (sigma-70 family)